MASAIMSRSRRYTGRSSVAMRYAVVIQQRGSSLSCIPVGYDRPEIGPRPLLGLAAGGAEEDEAGDTRAGMAQSLGDDRRIGGPAGQPAADEALGMGGVEQGGAGGTGGQFLLPLRDM